MSKVLNGVKCFNLDAICCKLINTTLIPLNYNTRDSTFNLLLVYQRFFRLWIGAFDDNNRTYQMGYLCCPIFMIYCVMQYYLIVKYSKKMVFARIDMLQYTSYVVKCLQAKLLQGFLKLAPVILNSKLSLLS